LSPAEAAILGLVQGLTEFLPVSSDGHLALAELLLGSAARAEGQGLFFELVLHLATMLAIIVAFRREILGLAGAVGRGPDAGAARRVVALIAVASVPTAVVGLLVRDAATAAYARPALVGLGLLATSLCLASTIASLGRRPRVARAETPEAWMSDLAAIRWRDAVLIGAAQGTAVWPGLSRSGTTISSALWLGIPPVAATRFSLLVSLPAVAGGFILELGELRTPPPLLACAIGFAVALASGFLAIGWLVAVVRGARLGWFAAYTALLGLVAIGCSLAG
jgi:undecaprenyl-diphosphatase